MECKLALLVSAIVLLTIVGNIQAQQAPIVQLKGGKVQGYEEQVGTTGGKVNVYQGIRYGK